MNVVVVGAGIAGLAATHRLVALLPESRPVLLESEPDLGGKLRTERLDGFVIEAAADSFLSRKARGVGLCEELGLDDELVGRRPEYAHTFVRRGRELHPLPEGLTGTIPTNLDALEGSALLSPEGKSRLAAEAGVPVARGAVDESIASFVSRRLGREAYENLVEPLMTGIYGGDGEQLSLQSTFPQLRALELERGSILKGLADQAPDESGYPPFVSLASGMGTLVERLAGELAGRAEVVAGVRAVSLRRRPGGFEVELERGDVLEADAVILATPAFVSASLLADVDPLVAEQHEQIPYASSAIVSVAYREQDVPLLQGYGYVVPCGEGSEVLACTWSSRKWEGRAPEGTVLLRVYAGRFGGRDVTELGDGELIALASEEVELLGIGATPILTMVHRWPRGMPQYVVGHSDHLARIAARLAELPGLALAGAAYRGVGIPDCIHSGEQAAESVVRVLAGARA